TLSSINHAALTDPPPLSLHDALPISAQTHVGDHLHWPRASSQAHGGVPEWPIGTALKAVVGRPTAGSNPAPSAQPSRCLTAAARSEEHTSELQSRFDLVCRLLLEKKQ